MDVVILGCKEYNKKSNRNNQTNGLITIYSDRKHLIEIHNHKID